MTERLNFHFWVKFNRSAHSRLHMAGSLHAQTLEKQLVLQSLNTTNWPKVLCLPESSSESDETQIY